MPPIRIHHASLFSDLPNFVHSYFPFSVHSYFLKFDIVNFRLQEAEQLFFYDSLFALDFASLESSKMDNDKEFIMGIQSVHLLLEDFNLSLEEKYKLVSRMQEAFLKEFGGGKQLQAQLNNIYRKNKDKIRNCIEKNVSTSISGDEAVTVLEERSNRNKEVVSRIKLKCISKLEGLVKLDELLPHYIHMSINRLYLSNQRRFEFQIYHMLERYYFSKLSIERKGGITAYAQNVAST